MGFKENKMKRYLSKNYRTDDNLIKIARNNTFTHEIVKCCICYILKLREYDFVTEARFENGRADVFCLSNQTIYEILYSESIETFEKKKKYYPNVNLVPIDSKVYKSSSLGNIYNELNSLIK